MVRGLLKLALLAGAGWFAYRKLAGSGNGSSATERAPFARDERTDWPADAEPPEARAAAMAAIPAVQPPATIPEPELRAS
jgi:hypothetical protein